MFYFVSIIFFYCYYYSSFLIHSSDAIKQVDDNMFIAYIKDHQETQLSEYSMQKYEAHLGIMYYMRKNWQCDKIGQEFKEYERTECQKYRKYLDILYEYLNRKYAGITTVKPKFVYKDRKNHIEIEGPIIYAINCLWKISKFYSQALWWNKLNNFFLFNFEPKLLNEKRLNYEQKLPINEMILQLAIDTANKYQTNENLDGIIRPNFEIYLEGMFNKVEKRAPKYICLWRFDKQYLIIGSKFDDQSKWVEDALFSEFVKGMATNFEKFISLIKGYNKMKDNLMQKYEAHLGLVYLMRKNWQCLHIFNAFEENEREKCQIYRKYFYILYEYLFRVYVEAKNGEEAKQLPAVKPIFFEYFLTNQTLIDVIRKLNGITKCLWEKGEKKFLNFDNILNIHLENEEELNSEMKEETNWINENVQKIIKKFIRPKNVLNGPTEIEILREEFEKKMEKLCENAKANAANDEENENLENEYNLKFGTFNSSPFL